MVLRLILRLVRGRHRCIVRPLGLLRGRLGRVAGLAVVEGLRNGIGQLRVGLRIADLEVVADAGDAGHMAGNRPGQIAGGLG